jgi:hypothetical protein
VIDDRVTLRAEPLDQVLLELEAGVIGTEGDACHVGRV